MSEAALQVVQVGRESAVGTSVAATQVFPVDQGFTGFELDRATESPDEDYGGASRERPGRGSHGVRGATASATQTMCFEDFQKILEMHADTITIPTGTSITLANPSAEADDIIDTTGAHGLAAGDQIVFSALTGGSGLTTNRIYYVIAANLASTTFQVSLTLGGAAVDFSTDITAGTALKGPFTWTYAMDESTGLISTAVKHYTWEYGDPLSTEDEMEAASVIINGLDIGFDALSAPGNAMWKANLDLLAVNRAQAAMTSSLSAPAVRETMEGHLTTFAEGSTSTAFGSLSALGSSLKQFSLTSNLNAVIRTYGGSSDVGVSYGRSAKAEVEGSALIAIGATSLTNIHDIYNVSGAVPTERRWRITIDGSGVNAMTIDLRPRFTAVNRADHEGEILYAVDFVGVYDSTLASRATFSLTNAVAAHV